MLPCFERAAHRWTRSGEVEGIVPAPEATLGPGEEIKSWSAELRELTEAEECSLEREKTWETSPWLLREASAEDRVEACL